MINFSPDINAIIKISDGVRTGISVPANLCACVESKSRIFEHRPGLLYQPAQAVRILSDGTAVLTTAIAA